MNLFLKSGFKNTKITTIVKIDNIADNICTLKDLKIIIMEVKNQKQNKCFTFAR